jgi:hypothetical protein
MAIHTATVRADLTLGHRFKNSHVVETRGACLSRGDGDRMPHRRRERHKETVMKRSYLCPKCDGVLNPNIKIILKTEIAGRAALVLFSPQPGNYHVIVPESFRLKKGD